MNFMLIAVIVLGAIALVAAAVLFVCSKKFAVKEDPRIAQVSAVLPRPTVAVADSQDALVWPMHW